MNSERLHYLTEYGKVLAQMPINVGHNRCERLAEEIESELGLDQNSRYGRIARMCHEVNRAYCISIGDDSQPSWDDAPDWQRESAINGVLFHLKNKTITPEQSHESWMRQKDEEGWVYGEVKDPIAKTHPCMVPYDELPAEQWTKDYLFKAVVDSFKKGEK